MYIVTAVLMIFIFSFSLRANLKQRFYFSHLLYPYGIRNYKQYYPILTSNFIHAGYLHLGINLGLIYIFGNELERVLLAGGQHWIWVLLIWLLASIAGGVTDFILKRNQEQFYSCGASNGVMAIIAAYLTLDVEYFLQFYDFLQLEHFFVLALVIAATLYGLSQKNSNINYRSHFVGILIGFSMGFLIKVISS